MSDISNLIGGYGVQLESKALNQFGAAVGDYGKSAGLGPLAGMAQNAVTNKGLTTTSVGGIASVLGVDTIDGLLGMANSNRQPTRSASGPVSSIFGANTGDSMIGTSKGTWQSSRYASDLVAYAPKHRFIFKVKFIFNDPYSRINREFMYVVKEIDKPKVTFEYEEINMYNFKTKVLKSIRHEPLSMTFHDDIKNKVLDFFNAYRVAYSPISSLTYEQKIMFEEAGMDFYQPGSGGVNSASMGVLENGNVNILNYIEVAQVYAHGTRQNKFIFTNPRIETFDFDNLSHESSEGNGLSVSFNYDALYVYDEITTGTPEYSWGTTDILGNSESGSRNQFGNMTMGGDSNIRSSSLGGVSNVLDARGIKINAVDSAFPTIAGSIKGITSSANELVDSARSTIASAVSSISQATAGLWNNTRMSNDTSMDVPVPNNLDSMPDAGSILSSEGTFA